MQTAEWPTKLVEGADFYMQPIWHPSGEAIAWVEWDHPNMPWDGTRLMYAVLEGDPPEIQAAQNLAGGQDVPILQPAFSPDGRYLSYVQNQGEWDQLILQDLQTGTSSVLVEGASLLKPAWIQGVRVQAWSHKRKGIYFLQYKAGVTALNFVDVLSGEVQAIEMSPYTSLSQLTVSLQDRIALLANAPSISTRVISLTGVK